MSVLPVNQTIITYQIKKRQRDEPKQIEESDNCPSTASGFQLETLQQQGILFLLPSLIIN